MRNWKEYRKTLILASIVTVLPILIGVYFWKQLPEVMATHFGFDSQADGFSSKAFTVFGLPLFLLALQWVMVFVVSHDPRKQNITPKIFTCILWIIPLVSLGTSAGTYAYNLGYSLDISFWAGGILGFLFLVIGNYLPKVRQNYTVGIRIPWTLAEEENWNRTHRLAGHLWVAGGLLILLLTLTRTGDMKGMLVITLLIAIVPCLYSFSLHLKQERS